MPKYWWVNQNQTYNSEVGGGFLWSPKRNRDGGFNKFYENMREACPGDLVFSFSDTLIRAVGVVQDPARTAEKPPEFGSAGQNWERDGWLVSVSFQELEHPIKPAEYIDRLRPHLPPKYSPLQDSGRGNQGVYLAEIPSPMASILLDLLGRQAEGVKEDAQEQIIHNRTDVPATEKLQLIKARLGQGIYRSNLERIEPCCRLTGISDRRFLVASHIKPWSISTDREKLDGNNGLLLSPHVDRLFDRGYLTFEDCGTLAVSRELPKSVADAWGIGPGNRPRALNNQQRVYMEFHRTSVFERKLHAFG